MRACSRTVAVPEDSGMTSAAGSPAPRSTCPEGLRSPTQALLSTGGAVGAAVRAVDRLNRERANALQIGRQRRQRATRRLRFRNRIIRIVDRLVHAVDLRRKLLTDRKTRSVVRGAVDAQARGQTLQRLRQCRFRARQVTLRVERVDIAIKC